MSKVSIRVVVAGRSYPLTVNEGEETKIQQAADEINKAIKLLQDNYAVKDMQDLLSMTALQLATKSKNTTPKDSSSNADFSEIEEKLQDIKNQLD